MRGVYKSLKTKSELLIRKQPKNKNEYYQFYDENNENFSRLEKPTLENAVVIRWGTRLVLPTNKGTIVYNKAEAIANATNKKLARKLMAEGGVRVPQAVIPETIEKHQYPVIARPSYHSKGKNFVVLNNEDDFIEHYENSTDDWYYSEFVNKQEEYRVHCGSGKILSVMIKPKPEDENQLAWNRAINGEAFDVVKWSDYQHDVCLQALKAVKVLGLTFGGCDIIVKDGKAYVLEVNTSPTLNSSPYTTQRYVKYFDWLFASENRRECFEFEKFKDAKSFSWKEFNFQDRKPIKK